MHANAVRQLLFLTFTVLLCPLAACRGGGGPYSPQREASRNPLEAQRLTMRAADLLQRSPPETDGAEKLLREALAADLYHGPAHNDLGVVYLKQGNLYSAAGEFEWARKLLPGHPDPRVNLALTLERAGRTTDALREYAAALEVCPGHIPTLQALARLQVRHSRTDDTTRQRLQTISLEGETPSWREWARAQLVR